MPQVSVHFHIPVTVAFKINGADVPVKMYPGFFQCPPEAVDLAVKCDLIQLGVPHQLAHFKLIHQEVSRVFQLLAGFHFHLAHYFAQAGRNEPWPRLEVVIHPVKCA
ncbi:hypothetical protein D9M69_602250 [compost metagenome]